MSLAVNPVGEPDAGNPHVRFDERGLGNGTTSESLPRPPSTLLRTKGVIGNAELYATSKWPSTLPASHDGRSLR